jgi:molybdate transport system ATP-binding protein
MLEVQIVKQLNGFRLDASFTASGAISALVGPSGSGKTLTLRAIAGALRPDEGRIALDGEPFFDSEQGVELPPQRRRVGYVPQQYALFPHLDVRGNVGFGLRQMSRAEARERVDELIALVKLTGLERLRPLQLSGGQQQRVALARALIVRPRILLLDEPFAALDAPIRVALRRELLELQRSLGFRALLVTHDPEDAALLADQTFAFEAGRARDDRVSPRDCGTAMG